MDDGSPDRARSKNSASSMLSLMPKRHLQLHPDAELSSIIPDATHGHNITSGGFVELWNRSEAEALPWEVMERIGHDESRLDPMYADIEEHLGQLREFVASGKT